MPATATTRTVVHDAAPIRISIGVPRLQLSFCGPRSTSEAPEAQLQNMPAQSSSRQSRRPLRPSASAPEVVPFLQDTSFSSSPDLSPTDFDLENGPGHQDEPRHVSEEEYLLDSHLPRHSPTWRIPTLKSIIVSTRRLSRGALDKPSIRRPSILRRLLRIAGILLMLL